MNQSITFNTNLQKLSTFAEKLALINKPSDIILLQGELGTGKTTFTRFWINALYRKKKALPPSSVKSPTFPIMISYDLGDYEVYHYDLYRLKSGKDISQLGMFEASNNHIKIVEWPELIKPKPTDRVEILFKYADLDNTRIIQTEGFGKWKNYKFK